MIYFDNAATGGRKPDSVLAALSASLKNPANPGRSGHALSLGCAMVVQNARSALNSFFNGYGVERVAFTKNCTEGLNIAIFSALSSGGNAVCDCFAHNSVLRPLEHLKRTGKATYTVVEPNKEGKIDYACAVTKETKAVIVTACSNVTGESVDIASVKATLPPHVLLLVDGAQAAGHYALDMQNTGMDALAVPGHKGLHAVQGSGALLFSSRFSPTPLLFGGTGSDSMQLLQPTFYPDALESGTLSFPAISTLFEGVLYAKLHMEEDKKYVYALTELLISKIRSLPKIKVYSKPNCSGIVSFAHKLLPSQEVADILSTKFSIAVRGGLHCAPLAHKYLGTQDTGLVRASLSAFNTKEEALLLERALRRI